MISPTPTSLSTVVKVKFGGSAYLPCKCERWNTGGNMPPKWINSRGKYVLLSGPEGVPPSQRKYSLFNDMRRWKIAIVHLFCVMLPGNTQGNIVVLI